MKQRILSGWNWIRVIYLILGVFIIIQSILMQQWVGSVLGGWFAAMGLFGLGCAAGACYINTNKQIPNSKNHVSTNEIDPVKTRYEEIKGA